MTDFDIDNEQDPAQIIPDENELLEVEQEQAAIQSESEAELDPEESLEVKFVSNSSDSEEDENEILLPDDAEEDLLTILESKINSELVLQEDLESQFLIDDNQEFLIAPKRVDEQHCQRCWLLVRRGSPKCPMHDDDCPVFS